MGCSSSIPVEEPAAKSQSNGRAAYADVMTADADTHAADNKQQQQQSQPPPSSSALSTASTTRSSASKSSDSNADSAVREARRLLASLSPILSGGLDPDYFESGDLDRSLVELAASLGLDSIATTRNGQSNDNSLDVPLCSVDAVQLSPAGSEGTPSLTDIPQIHVVWRQGQLLGSGSFGEVYLGLDDEMGSLMAVKKVNTRSVSSSDNAAGADAQPPPTPTPPTPADQARLAKLAKEVALLSRLSHPNIVEYRGMNLSAEDGSVNIFMEYVPGGSIAHLLKRFGTFNEKLIRRYTKDILQGLAYLHLKGIVHRDIKAANVLVDTNGRAKLADFGASFSLGEVMPPGTRPSIEGTPFWMAPEVIRQQQHGRKVDVWSLGCTVVEMFSGRPPWQQFKTQLSALYHIGSTSDPPQLPSNLSEDARDFCLYCLERDPAKRPNVFRLLEHPFITEPYTGPNTKVKLPPKERLKQSAAGVAGGEHTAHSADGSTQGGIDLTSGAAATATSFDDDALTPEQADGLEDEIAAFLRQEQEALKQQAQIEQIKQKL